jgi:TDG/mug DNA glycosylase family protein
VTTRLLGLASLDSGGARILVLGSFPSVRSLEKGEYYGHDRNHFWEVLGAVLGRPAPAEYDARRDYLARAGIAVWDVIAACERDGSLDRDIKSEEANPILDFLSARPSILRIALNGGKAAEAFVAMIAPELAVGARAGGLVIGEARVWAPPSLEGRRLVVVRVPSTSPVPTRAYKKAADKAAAWKEALG